MRFLVVLGLGAASMLASADERFYTTVDAQGRVQVIKDEPAPAPAQKPASARAPATAGPVTSQAVSPPAAQPSVRQLDAETYVDVEELERTDFNPERKKRFYHMPDGGLGPQVVEIDGGLATATATQPVPVSRPVSFVSTSYQVLTGAELQAGLPGGSACLARKYLDKHARPFKARNNVWVRPALGERGNEAEAVFRLDEHASIRFLSFAESQKHPEFYLPLVVFLNEQGCPLSGAWRYWSQAHPANDKQYASVDGLLSRPEGSTYVLFYRPVDSLTADIPFRREAGSFVVEVY